MYERLFPLGFSSIDDARAPNDLQIFHSLIKLYVHLSKMNVVTVIIFSLGGQHFTLNFNGGNMDGEQHMNMAKNQRLEQGGRCILKRETTQ